MNFAYSSMKTLPGRTQVEVLRVVAERFAVHAAPHQAAVGVDVDLGHAELGGALELVRIHALGALELAAGGVDARDLVLRDRAGAVHDQREAGQALLDLLEHVEVQALRCRRT